MPNDRSRSPLSYDMGHNVVLYTENLHAKWKVWTMFSLLWQQALPAVKCVDGTVVGWCYCCFYTHTRSTTTTKSNQIQDRMSVNKYSQIVFLFMINQRIWKWTNFQSLIADTWCHRGCQYLKTGDSFLTLWNSENIPFDTMKQEIPFDTVKQTWGPLWHWETDMRTFMTL